MARTRTKAFRRAAWLFTSTALALVVTVGAARLVSAQAAKKELIKVGTVQVWTWESSPDAVFYEAKMSLDADGAPKAYHEDSSKALDYLGNAGKPGNWWALITDTRQPNGTPIKQGPNDPAPGYYVSATSLADGKYKESDPRRFIDASTIPYIALPPELKKEGKIALGDLSAVINTKNDKVKYAIFADGGNRGHIGEGSIWLGNELRDQPFPDPDAKKGGFDKGIVYVVFPGSGEKCGNPRTVTDIEREGEKLFLAWGGMNRVKEFFPRP